MGIYASNKSLKKSAYTSKGNPIVPRKSKLKSCLLKNNKELQRIYENKLQIEEFTYYNLKLEVIPPDPELKTRKVQLKTNTKSTAYKGKSHIVKIQKSAYILVQELGRISGHTKVEWKVDDLTNNTFYNGKFSGLYDNQTKAYVKEFQRLAGFSIQDQDGIVGPKTIAAMDRELNKIRYYDCGGENGKPTIGHNASLCEDVAVYTKVYKTDTNLYKIPDTSFSVENRITALLIGTTVHIIQDVSNQYPGLVYVQIDQQIPGTSSDPKYKSLFGYVAKSQIWTKSSMPDCDSKLYDIVTGDTVIKLIKTHYYSDTNNDGICTNKLDLQYRTDAGMFGINDVTLYNQFRFYVNLLLHANNKNVFNVGEPSIYLDKEHSGIYVDTERNKIENTNIFSNTNNDIANYDYFLNILDDQHTAILWDAGETISLVADRKIWIPSQKFADALYSYLNNNNSHLVKIQNDIRILLKDKWPRGVGVTVEGSLAATFGIPVKLGVGSTFKMYRKYTANNNDVVICLSKTGVISAGLDTGVGVGFEMGSGKKGKQDLGLGTAIGAQGSLLSHWETVQKYEFPINNPSTFTDKPNKDLSAFALMASLPIVDSSIEFIAVSLTKAFTDFNIDPLNYLTKFEVYLASEAQGSAGARAGIILGQNTSDKNFWKTLPDGSNSNNPEGSRNSNDVPWHFRKIISILNAKLDMNASAEIGNGFSYEASYNGLCFDRVTGARAPEKFTLSLNTDANFLLGASANLGPLTASLLNIHPHTGLEISFEYYNGNDESTFFSPRSTKFQNNGLPKIKAYAGNGSWDEYDGSAVQVGICLNGLPSSLPNLNALRNQIDYIYLKKRFSLLNMSTGILKDIAPIQNKLVNYFKNKSFYKFGASAGAYLDVEVRISQANIQTITSKINEILTLTYQNLDNNYKNDWLGVFSSLPNIVSTISDSKSFPKIKKLFFEIAQEFTLQNISIHGEVSFGVNLNVDLALALKIGLEIEAILSLTYDQGFIEDGIWNMPPEIELLARKNVMMLKNIVESTPEINKVFMLTK